MVVTDNLLSGDYDYRSLSLKMFGCLFLVIVFRIKKLLFYDIFKKKYFLNKQRCFVSTNLSLLGKRNLSLSTFNDLARYYFLYSLSNA